MATSYSVQTAFRARDDSQVLSSSVFTYNQNTNWTQDTDIVFRLRLEVEEQNGKNFNLLGTIQYSLNGGAWTSITTSSSVVKAVPSNQFNDADPTTNLLTGSSKAFVAGEGSEDATPANMSLNNTHTEHEYALQIISTDVANGDTIQIRLVSLSAYSQTPTITVNVPSQNINENVSLSKYLGIISIGNINLSEIVGALQKFSGIGIQGISVAEEGINLSKIIYQYNLENFNSFEETVITIFKNLIALEEAQGQINENVILTRLNAINQLNNTIEEDNLSLLRLNAVSQLNNSIEKDDISLIRLNDISELDNSVEEDNVDLARLNDIGELDNSIEEDNVSLIRLDNIIVLEETQGQINESITLTRRDLISIFQEGASHVEEGIIFSRLNGISQLNNTIEQDNLSLIRFNYLTVLEDIGQINENVILTRLNAINQLNNSIEQDFISLSYLTYLTVLEETQGNYTENVVLNRLLNLNNDTELLADEVIGLSKFNLLEILDSKYLLENAVLQRSNSLISVNNLNIFENVNLVKINIIGLISLLFGTNSISLGQIKSIMAEPPSLYIYANGDHSVSVLFRDKRANSFWRDKRAYVPFRDKTPKIRS